MKIILFFRILQAASAATRSMRRISAAMPGQLQGGRGEYLQLCQVSYKGTGRISAAMPGKLQRGQGEYLQLCQVSFEEDGENICSYAK